MILYKGQDTCFKPKQYIGDTAPSQNQSDKSFACPTYKKIEFKPNPTKKRTQTIILNHPVSIIGRSSVVSKTEGKGPLAKHFSVIFDDDRMGQKSFEKAELKMLSVAVNTAIENSSIDIDDIDAFLSGDLLNQITSSSYLARELNLPYIGVYSACSTMSQSLLLGATMIDSTHFDTIACATASHFATAERQYRYPLEYGCQRPPFAQWTVTGAGCTILSKGESAQKNFSSSNKNLSTTVLPKQNYTPKITMGIVGKVVDFGINDINNMGAAMAPAAVDTLTTMLTETTLSLTNIDLIVTGDLGKLGSDIFRDLLKRGGIDLGGKYIDCGAIIYDHSQKCYQGGSGAGCSAVVFNSFILDRMKRGDYKRVVFLATGALMNPTMFFQGETIPCICHGVVVENF